MKASRLAIALLIALPLGCHSKPAPTPRQVAPVVTRDVPAILRGTIGAECSLRNNEPVLVSGYGVVVGLRGTGGGQLPDRIAATMERQLGLKGIAKGSDALKGTAFEGMSPREMLRSRDVAVVIVYGAVVPGAPKGANFDVYVSPVSQSADLSLEGGVLWSTELRVGPPTPFDGVKTAELAIARGPIFVNPFATPGAGGPSRSLGRVLGGGSVTKPIELQLILDNESHTRARAITDAINNRFGKQPGRLEDVAHGRTARTIQITVPPEYKDRAGDFLNLITAIQIQQNFPQEFAKRYADAMRSEPYLSSELSWCLQALPDRAAVPFLRDLYEEPEIGVRLAALRAGAALNDPLAVTALQRLAANANVPATRAEAVALLGKIQAGPGVDLALRDQLAAPELTVRVAAYEALASRAERAHLRRAIAQRQDADDAGNPGPPEIAASLSMPGDTIQGVRRDVVPRAFLLDQVSGGEPLIYIAQQGRPRIVVFGDRPTLNRPLVFSTWGDRLMLAAESPTDDIRVRFRDLDRDLGNGEKMSGEVTTTKAPPDLASFILFLAHKPSPEDPRPGLGLNYSEVVGVLYQLQRAGAVDASFSVEDDLLQARLLQATQQLTNSERPETSKDAERQLRIMDPVNKKIAPADNKPDRQPLVVPLPQPVPDKKK